MQTYRTSLIVTCLIISLVFLSPRITAETLHVSANNAILMEQSTGAVLYEKDAHDTREIASITKIMTALIALESNQLKEKTKTSRRAINVEGSSIYLEQGEEMTINDLVYGLMLRSGNDAAIAISEHVGGSVEGFVHLMNEKADWLGMTNTNFTNPHGLSNENHYSTAYDMALLMRYAMKNDDFMKVSGSEQYQAETRTYPWQNKNKLLTMYDDRCTGGKTGFTKSSGRTLVSSASQNNTKLIVVTLNAPDDWRDHIALYDWGFNESDRMRGTAAKTYENINDDYSLLEQIMITYQRIIGLNSYD